MDRAESIDPETGKKSTGAKSPTTRRSPQRPTGKTPLWKPATATPITIAAP